MSPQTHTVTIDCDASPLLLFIELVRRAVEVSKVPLDVRDLDFQYARIEQIDSPTDAVDLLVRFYPSDAFLRYVAALLARDFNLGPVEQTHGDLRGMSDV